MLETPGGLRIQTIHGFAQTLLASFPAEAGITPGFQPIEGRAEAELIRRTLATLLADAEASGNDALIADVQALSLRLGEGGAQEYLTTCASAEEMIDALGDPAGFEAALLGAIGIGEANAADAIAAQARRRRDRPADDRGADRASTARGAPRPARRSSPISPPSSPPPRSSGSPCSTASARSSSPPRASRARRPAGRLKVHPDYTELLERIRALAGQSAAACAAPPSSPSIQAAGLRAGQAFARAYRLAKRAAGVADFDDLIAWTRGLLGIDGMGEWVRFKLDQRTDHILVDEAQDTNADQWAIVDALASEYFSGQSETDRRWRTLFMVGDYKQAIFGFQGTDPRAVRRLSRDRRRARRRGGRGGARQRGLGARIPRPVDRRQLPLLAADPASWSMR